jgi:hypothetical protein
MMPIIDYFDRAYIINLKHRTDRRRQVTREFRRMGINIPNDKVLFYDAARPSEAGVFQNIGIRGAFISHRNILEVARRDNLRNVLIFEDDVSFRRTSEQLINTIVARLSEEDWDVVYFGYAQPPDGSVHEPLSVWHGDVLGAHFYGVNGRFISGMLQYLRECELRPRHHPHGGPMPLDGAYNHVRHIMPDVKLLLPSRSLAYQRSSRTDISPVKFFDRTLYLNPIVASFRATKHWMKMTADRMELRRRAKKT